MLPTRLMSEEEVRGRLLKYFGTHPGSPGMVDPQMDLLQAGVLDSLMIIDLVAYIESDFGISIRPRDISPSNFRTVATMTRLITDKLSLGK